MILNPEDDVVDEPAEEPVGEPPEERLDGAVTEVGDEVVEGSVSEELDEAGESDLSDLSHEPEDLDVPADSDASEELTDSDESDVSDISELLEASDGEEDAVTFDGDRPVVRELEYQAPKLNKSAEEDEGSDTKFSSVAEAKAVVEGFLFSCNEPLSVQKLSKLMGNLHPKTVRGLLLELQWDYENHHGALQVIEIAGGYQLCTRAFVAPWMFRLHKHKRRSALSPATLETLAIIAYRQPITRGEIEGIRGVESSAPVRTLQDLNLVEASGRREVVGRPQLYVTTEQFLRTFGLKSVGDLPSISELKSRFAEEQKLKPVTAAAVAAVEEKAQEVAAAAEELGAAAPEDLETGEEAAGAEELEASDMSDLSDATDVEDSEQVEPAERPKDLEQSEEPELSAELQGELAIVDESDEADGSDESEGLADTDAPGQSDPQEESEPVDELIESNVEDDHPSSQ